MHKYTAYKKNGHEWINEWIKAKHSFLYDCHLSHYSISPVPSQVHAYYILIFSVLLLKKLMLISVLIQSFFTLQRFSHLDMPHFFILQWGPKFLCSVSRWKFLCLVPELPDWWDLCLAKSHRFMKNSQNINTVGLKHDEKKSKIITEFIIRINIRILPHLPTWCNKSISSTFSNRPRNFACVWG